MEVLHLTPTERGELQSYLRKRNLPASVAQRMRIVLLLDEGTSYRDIEEKLGAAPSTVSRWKQRYEKDGVLGLATIHPGQPPQKLTPQLRAKVLERTRQAPPDGSTHWSLRKMAAVMKVNKNLIARIWKEADLKPHRLERYMASNDPEFEEKGSARPPLALIARAGRETRLRVLPARDVIAVRRPEPANRRGHRPDRRAPYQPGVCRLLRRSRLQPTCRARDSRHPGQLRNPQNGFGEALPSTAPQREIALHPHLLLVAQSG